MTKRGQMLDKREVVLQNYQRVIAMMQAACRQSNCAESEVKLIVVTKLQSAEKIRWVLEAGHCDFAENKIQEIQEKWPPLLAEFPTARLHFIGPIQSNKVKNIVKYAHFIHSVDRWKIAEKIAHECQMQNKSPQCLIQVNIGNESQKSGLRIEEFAEFYQKCLTILHLKMTGAMCIPPAAQNPNPYFRLMHQLQLECHFLELSMGMSDDFVQAIANAASMIRVGSKIFGSQLV